MAINPEPLERMLANGQESAVLRFSLGNAYLELAPTRAVGHFLRATELDPDYSAAWKMLGRAYVATGAAALARRAFERGIEIAQAKGDVQAAKEMRVFLNRLNRAPE
jgi:predicted Zn-dependent protease